MGEADPFAQGDRVVDHACLFLGGVQDSTAVHSIAEMMSGELSISQSVDRLPGLDDRQNPNAPPRSRSRRHSALQGHDPDLILVTDHYHTNSFLPTTRNR